MADCLKVDSVDEFDDINRDLGYEIEYRPLSGKAFHATMLFDQRNGWLLSRERMTGPVEVYFAEPQGFCSILLPFADGEVLVNGVRAADGVAYLLAPGQENRLVASGDVGARVMRVPLSAAKGVARECGIDWSGGRLCRFQAINLGCQALGHLESAIDSALETASVGSHRDQSGHQRPRNLLPEVLESRAASVGLSPGKHESLFVQASSFIDAKLPGEITVDDLSGELQMSVRHVQRVFSQTLGMTPTHYIESRRFDMARRRLLTADRSFTKVSDIALAMGFKHLGRFSTAYHARFGEYARDTLSRSRIGDAKDEPMKGLLRQFTKRVC